MDARWRIAHTGSLAVCVTLEAMSSEVTHLPGSTPLVLDSPHSGTRYPADFGSACDLPTLRRAEDTHVEKIYAFAPCLVVGCVV